MNFIWDGIEQAWHLLLHPDDALLDVVEVTLRVAFLSTLIALAIGLPIGLALGLGRFRGRGAMLTLANAGLALPPVLVGLVAALLLFRQAPLGGLDLIYTVNGVIFAQALLSIPIVAALSAASIQALPADLIEQARALGASGAQRWALAIREARIGIVAAAAAALGSALSEVGLVVLVGGNITGETQTLASAILTEVAAGDYGRGIAFGVLLVGLILVLSAVLTVVQHGSRPGPGPRRAMAR
ncbi:MAG: ABC transporter permease [Solirubrobacterales bacterium]